MLMKDSLDNQLLRFSMILHSMILKSEYTHLHNHSKELLFTNFRCYKPAVNGQTSCTISAQHDSVYVAGWEYFL